jgi:hypothetical protein
MNPENELQFVNFFYQELSEQEYTEEGIIDWDDCSQGSVEMESYDP